MLQITNQKLEGYITLLLATCEAADYGILILAPNGEVVNFNRKLVEIWQISPDHLVAKDGNEFLAFVLEQSKKKVIQ